MQKIQFERLGGNSGIFLLVNDTVETPMNNPAVNARFLSFINLPERLVQIKKHTGDISSAGSGGSSIYTGKDMVTIHTGMNFNPTGYMYVIDNIFIALNKKSVNEETKTDVLAILCHRKR